DVPFHPRYLWSGIMPFHAFDVFTDLSKKIHANLLDPSLLDGVYIPNLVASPFTVHETCAELIYNCALLLRLSKVLRKQDEERWGGPRGHTVAIIRLEQQIRLLE
ncbi:hypothetical protein BC827DRAFT_1130373, partial [Russula dissimulans]